MSETLLCQPAASHFVDGLAREDNAGTVLHSVNPATGAVIASLHSATPQIIADAVASARRAQAGWAGLPLVERGRVLQRAAAIMRARNRELSVLETRDTGKPLSETLVATPKVCTGSPAKLQPKICGRSSSRCISQQAARCPEPRRNARSTALSAPPPRSLIQSCDRISLARIAGSFDLAVSVIVS